MIETKLFNSKIKKEDSLHYSEIFSHSEIERILARVSERKIPKNWFFLKPKIIIFYPIIVSGNMEFIHYEFAEQLNNEGFEVIFWGVAHASKRINSKYKIVKPRYYIAVAL